MIRWIGQIFLWVFALSVLWILGARTLSDPHDAAMMGVLGALAVAWMTPLWWSLERFLRAIALGLRFAVDELGQQGGVVDAAGQAAHQTGEVLLLRATESGLDRSGAPVWMFQAAPTVVTWMEPLLAAPVDARVGEARQAAVAGMQRWLRRINIVRTVLTLGAAVVLVAPPTTLIVRTLLE